MATDAFTVIELRFFSSLFSAWGLFTTMLMALHWRGIRREITALAPRADFWSQNRREIRISAMLTIGIETPVSLVMIPQFGYLFVVCAAIYGVSQAVFAVYFLRAAFRMRASAAPCCSRAHRLRALISPDLTSMISPGRLRRAAIATAQARDTRIKRPRARRAAEHVSGPIRVLHDAVHCRLCYHGNA